MKSEKMKETSWPNSVHPRLPDIRNAKKTQEMGRILLTMQSAQLIIKKEIVVYVYV